MRQLLVEALDLLNLFDPTDTRCAGLQSRIKVVLAGNEIIAEPPSKPTDWEQLAGRLPPDGRPLGPLPDDLCAGCGGKFTDGRGYRSENTQWKWTCSSCSEIKGHGGAA